MVPHPADIALADPRSAQLSDTAEHPVVVQLQRPGQRRDADQSERPDPVGGESATNGAARGIATAILLAVPFWIAIVYAAFKIL